MDSIDRSRRKILRKAALGGTVGVTLGLAGCSGNGGGGDGGDGGGGGGDGTTTSGGDGGEETTEGGGGGGSGDYPAQEISMVVPFGAGGGTDTQYRGLKPYFEDQLGVTTVVDNRPGATGRTGFNYMSQQEPDGYTLGCISVATGCLGQELYDTQYNLKEASKVGISTAQYFAAVTKSGRFGGPQEFADWAKNADQVKLGSVGIGGSNHFLAVSILDTIGVSMDKVTSVPYDSGPEIAAAVARGEVDFGTPGELGTKSLQQKGDIDVLWIARPDESNAYPDKPVASDVAETLGVDSMPDWGLELGIFGPSGIESGQIETLETALLDAVENEEFQSWAEEQGLAVMAAGTDDLEERVNMYLERAGRYQELVDVKSN